MRVTKSQYMTAYKIAFIGLLLVATALVWSGCTKKLSGTAAQNQRPEVWFVNVPPEGAATSVNPIVNWVGQDRDGVIDYFRYIVVRENVMGEALGKPVGYNPTADPLTDAEVQTYIDGALASTSDTMWTYLYVNDSLGEPMTSNVIPMQAELTNPVLELVPQFVFVQAFDESGLGSAVASRRFFRNDNPPDTQIQRKFNLETSLFINSVIPTGPTTGIRLRWSGSDVLDHPSDAPPFEYQWKVFGPYTDSEYAALVDSFQTPVFVTNDAQIFYFGLPPDHHIDSIVCNQDSTVCDTFGYLVPTFYEVCDTTYQNGTEVVNCDTILIDTITGNNVYGVVDTILLVDSSRVNLGFVNSPLYRVADSSNDGFGHAWVNDESDSLFNLYRNFQSDSSIERNFIFWIRSRDDAQVADLTPDFATMHVIEPKHERDVLVLNAMDRGSAFIHQARPDSIWAYFDRTVNNWIQSRPDAANMEFIGDPTHDCHNVIEHFVGNDAEKAKFVRLMLSYKVMIVLSDATQRSKQYGDAAAETTLRPLIYTGLTAGTNVWVIGRNLFSGTYDNTTPETTFTSESYQNFFGVQAVMFTGWTNALLYNSANIQDFNQAVSINTGKWPDISVDSANVRNRYSWLDTPRPYGGLINYHASYFHPKSPMPEIGWESRTYESELMYLYGSIYGDQDNPAGSDYTFAGRPVAIRLDRGLFRTAHWKFSPEAMRDDEMQPVFNDMMNWLYDGRIDFTQAGKASATASAAAAMASAKHPANLRRLRQEYWDAFYNSNSNKEFMERLEHLKF